MKKKILFIPYTISLGGGAENIFVTLVNNLNFDKYDISVLEIEHFDLKELPLSSKIKRLPPLITPSDKKTKRKILLEMIEKRPKIIHDIFDLNGYDIVIAWTLSYPTLLSSFSHATTVIWIHGLAANLVFPASQEAAIVKSDIIVTISKQTQKSFQDLFPNYTGIQTLIYNAIDTERCTKLANEQVSFDFIKNEFPILIAIGSLDKNKNFSLIIRTLYELKACGIQCNLLILGAGNSILGDEKKSLQPLSKQLKVEESVYFLGYKQNPMPYIKHADILCLSSFSEGFPTVVCEAMALGKPFITTPVSGSSDELADNERCGLIAGYDEKEYAQKIALLLNDKNLYHKMSRNCIERIKDFSVANAVSSFDALVENIPIAPKPAKYRTIRKNTARLYSFIYILIYYIGGFVLSVLRIIKLFIKAVLPYGFVRLIQKQKKGKG